jgi:hypothetical protein
MSTVAPPSQPDLVNAQADPPQRPGTATGATPSPMEIEALANLEAA